MPAHIILITLFWLSCVAGAHRFELDLSGGAGEWSTSNSNGSNPIHIPASVPGGIYSDLIAAKVIQPDIFYRSRDVELRWVALDDWTYMRTFSVPKEILQTQTQVLSLLGVDTVASIYLNDHFLGNTSNMFVSYDFGVKPYLKLQNNLSVRIYSPITAAIDTAHSLPHPSPPECNPTLYHGECHVNVLRKMQASFAWDWGPAFPSMGIWKPIQLRCFNHLLLHQVTTQLNEQPAVWHVDIEALLQNPHNEGEMGAAEVTLKSPEVTMKATLHVEEGMLTSELHNRKVSWEDGFMIVQARMVVRKDLVQLWWPNGYGSQPLYKLDVVVRYLTPHGELELEKSVTIGFRTIRIVQDPVPNSKGLTFYFSVNDVPIFAKGSNYIPAHILPEKSADFSTVDRLLTSTVEANMNMLRVWGGGLYESDMFYERCDRYGILIWQDFMFACATYPTTEAFLKSVSAEITQQVRRLMNHPSIAVWAGNNENEVALRNNWYSTSSNESLYFAEYRKLYVDTIRPIVTRLDSTRGYLTSSPSNGKESERENFIADNPYDSLYGDTHTYNYFINPWNPDNYPIPRFCSEYGFQSLPSLSSLAKVSAPGDLDSLGTAFMGHRQHLPGGNLYLVSLLEHQIDLPNGTHDLDKFIYYTQINQAMSIKTETEVYRRHRSVLKEDGKGLTMGALYWQLNDVWQAPSWSSIEFSGRWKMLHFFAVKFFGPLLLSPTLDSDNLTLTFVNDFVTGVENVTLHVYVYTWNSTTPLTHVKKTYNVKKACSEVAWSLSMSNLSGGNNPDELFVRTSVTDAAQIPLIHDNFLFPTALKKAAKHLKPATVTVRLVRSTAPDIYQIHLYSDVITLFVWIELINLNVNESLVNFSDNGFHMVNQDHIIACSVPNVTSETLKNHIRIQAFNQS